MSFRINNLRKDSGSVLTEFLIVAPLYLALFGALMLLQDAMRVRGKVTMLDALVTEAGVHRLSDSQETLKTKYIPQSFVTFAPGTVKMKHAHVDLFTDDSGGSHQLSNGFCAVFGGRMDIEYTMPDFIYSLMAVQQVLFGEGVPKREPMTFFADDTKPYRFHFLQRHGDSDERATPAAQLISKGVLSKTLMDGWLFAEKAQGVEVKGAENSETEYRQQLGKYAE